MDFHTLFSIHVFQVKESMADIPTELPCSGVLENLGHLPVLEILCGTDNCIFMNFHNFFSIHIFEVKKSKYLARTHKKMQNLRITFAYIK